MKPVNRTKATQHINPISLLTFSLYTLLLLISRGWSNPSLAYALPIGNLPDGRQGDSKNDTNTAEALARTKRATTVEITNHVLGPVTKVWGVYTLTPEQVYIDCVPSCGNDFNMAIIEFRNATDIQFFFFPQRYPLREQPIISPPSAVQVQQVQQGSVGLGIVGYQVTGPNPGVYATACMYNIAGNYHCFGTVQVTVTTAFPANPTLSPIVTHNPPITFTGLTSFKLNATVFNAVYPPGVAADPGTLTLISHSPDNSVRISASFGTNPPPYYNTQAGYPTSGYVHAWQLDTGLADMWITTTTPNATFSVCYEGGLGPCTNVTMVFQYEPPPPTTPVPTTAAPSSTTLTLGTISGGPDSVVALTNTIIDAWSPWYSYNNLLFGLQCTGCTVLVNGLAAPLIADIATMSGIQISAGQVSVHLGSSPTLLVTACDFTGDCSPTKPLSIQMTGTAAPTAAAPTTVSPTPTSASTTPPVGTPGPTTPPDAGAGDGNGSNNTAEIFAQNMGAIIGGGTAFLLLVCAGIIGAVYYRHKRQSPLASSSTAATLLRPDIVYPPRQERSSPGAIPLQNLRVDGVPRTVPVAKMGSPRK